MSLVAGNLVHLVLFDYSDTKVDRCFGKSSSHATPLKTVVSGL